MCDSWPILDTRRRAKHWLLAEDEQGGSVLSVMVKDEMKKIVPVLNEQLKEWMHTVVAGERRCIVQVMNAELVQYKKEMQACLEDHSKAVELLCHTVKQLKDEIDQQSVSLHNLSEIVTTNTILRGKIETDLASVTREITTIRLAIANGQTYF